MLIWSLHPDISYFDKEHLIVGGITAGFIALIFGLLLLYTKRLQNLITLQKRTEEKLRLLSLTDELTGIHNRRGFITLAEQELKRANRLKKNKMLILAADMDGLKRINDTFGHHEGDLALIMFSCILKKTFRDSDIIARIGGDEFMVFQVENDINNSDTITARLQKNLDIQNARNSSYKLSLSIGTVYYDPQVHHSLDELMTHVDKMMYEQKRQHKSLIRVVAGTSPATHYLSPLVPDMATPTTITTKEGEFTDHIHDCRMGLSK